MLSADARRDGRLSKRGATASRDGGRRRRSSSAALVATVQPAHFRELDDAAFRRVLDPSWRRGVFVQRQVCSRSVIVREIPPEHAQQVSFAEDDAVVSHASLARPWRTRSRRIDRTVEDAVAWWCVSTPPTADEARYSQARRPGARDKSIRSIGEPRSAPSA